MAINEAAEKEWFEAAASGNDERVAELLTKWPDLIGKTKDDRTALFHACDGGHDNVVAKMLAMCPTIMNDTSVISACLCHASNLGHAKVVSQLLAASAGLEGFAKVVSFGGFTPLHLAALNGHENVVTQLLAARPDFVEALSSTRMNALHMAAQQGSLKICMLLLAACPKLIDARDAAGSSVLHYAAKGGNLELVEQILALRPESLTLRDRCGWDALRHAISFSHEAVAEKLLSLNPEFVHDHASGDSVLHDAVKKCGKEFVLKVWRMDPGALRVAAPRSRSPFHTAVYLQRYDLIDVFQWHMPLDEIVHDFTRQRANWQDRCRPIMREQCASLFELLNEDVMTTVFEYFGFDTVVRPDKRIKIPSEAT